MTPAGAPCLRWLRRDHPDVEETASRVVKDATRAAEIISRIHQVMGDRVQLRRF
jgi:hypothetical protein